MKGISPIIATIIILLVTIAIAGAAYSYISVIWSGTTEGIQRVDSSCLNGNATITFKNIGTKAIDSVTVMRTSPSTLSVTNISPSAISPGAQGVIHDVSCGANTMCIYKILVGGQSNEWYVQC